MRQLTGRQRRITVFCGAADATRQYLQAAAETGRLLAEHGMHIVYGGGRLGLMGALADAALAAGGHVTGILPHALHTPRITHPHLSNLQLVANAAERKEALTSQADAFLALPGGLGTLDELTQVWAHTALTGTVRPIGLLNINGYFTPLLDFLTTAETAGFFALHAQLRLDDITLADDDPARLLDAVVARMAPLETA